MSSECPPNKMVHLSSICHVPDTACVISADAHKLREGSITAPFTGEPAKQREVEELAQSHTAGKWQSQDTVFLTQSQCLFTTPTPPSCCRQTEPQT